jgi:tRNA G18 (ribose-2'-O)-methylase SpoU
MKIHLESVTDPRVADYSAIGDAERIRGRGCFVAEGRLVVERLLKSTAFETRAVLVTPSAMKALEEALAGHPGLPVYIVLKQVMDDVAGFDFHRGCLARVYRPSAARRRARTRQ